MNRNYLFTLGLVAAGVYAWKKGFFSGVAPSTQIPTPGGVLPTGTPSWSGAPSGASPYYGPDINSATGEYSPTTE